MAPSIALPLVVAFFAFHYDSTLNISVVTDLFFLGEVPNMFFVLSFNNDLKEYWAPGVSPGVVVIFTCSFNWALRFLMRWDLMGNSGTDTDNSWTNSSPTPNLSIK